MNIIEAKGDYVAVHAVSDENACVEWHGFNFKPWHVGVLACTRHGLTLVGVVSNVDNARYTWWCNDHGEFYAECYSIDSYTAPDCGASVYPGSYHDFLTCVDAAVEFLAAQDEVDYE